MNLRPLVPETSAKTISHWFARSLAAHEDMEMYALRQLSFPSLSQVSLERVLAARSSRWFRERFTVELSLASAPRQPDVLASVQKGLCRVLDYSSDHPGKHSRNLICLLTPRCPGIRRVVRKRFRRNSQGSDLRALEPGPRPGLSFALVSG